MKKPATKRLSDAATKVQCTPKALPPSLRRFVAPSLPGFTLVEVMISVALVLVLMIGINQIFSTTTATVSAGQALSAITRDNRAVQSVIFNDAKAAAAGGGPVLAINSSVRAAFRNRQDELSDADGIIRTIDLDGDGVYTAVGEDLQETAAPDLVMNYYKTTQRNHRTDTLGFFTRDLYRRQTGNDGRFAAPFTATEAWIWYGHLNQMNNADPKVAFAPGVVGIANHNNRYASQFAVGRMAMLLAGRDSGGTGEIEASDTITDQDGTIQLHHGRTAGGEELKPLGWGSTESQSGGTTIQQSRYDLAGTTITQFEQDVIAWSAGEPAWWQRMVFAGLPSGYPIAAPAPPADYVDYRFNADRYFIRPLTSANAALAAPYLLTGCSQFIVEFAGNFVAQDPASGAVTAQYDDAGFADTETDFIVVGTGPTAIKKTRWYGMYRDVNNDGTITLTATSPDVAPLSDFRPAGSPAPFERVIPIKSTGGGPVPRYTCVWGPTITTYLPLAPVVLPPRPTMIRITAVIDDPNGRLAEGQSYEYVLKLP